MNWPLVLRDSIYDHGKRKARVVARKLAKDLFTHVRSPTYFFLLKASLMMLYLFNPIWHGIWKTKMSSSAQLHKTNFIPKISCQTIIWHVVIFNLGTKLGQKWHFMHHIPPLVHIVYRFYKFFYIGRWQIIISTKTSCNHA